MEKSVRIARLRAVSRAVPRALAGGVIGAALVVAPAVTPAALVAPGGVGVSIVAPAAAVPPLASLPGQLIDETGLLSNRASEVQAAIDRVASETHYRLWVVYVDSFDGMQGLDWAAETAYAAGLGPNDILLAVATSDQEYGVSYSRDGGLSESQVDTITNAAVGALRQGDWAGAPIAMANSIISTVTGSAVPGTATHGASLWPLLLVPAAIAAGVGLYFWSRKHRPTATATGPRVVSEEVVSETVDLTALPTEELQRQAAAALVAVDDAIKTDEQELGFAQAEFGADATAEFSGVLAKAKADLAEAFRLQQLLDDTVHPLPEDERRAALIQIITLSQAASTQLDAQTASFDELRKLAERVPEVLADTNSRTSELEARIKASQAELVSLSSQYPADALASVVENPTQAEALVANARQAIADGQAALDSGDRNTAVAQARAAQNALGQAVILLDAVDTAGADLDHSSENLDAAIASITADLKDAQRLADMIDAAGDAAVEPKVREALAALEQAQAAKKGGDPLAALARLYDAEAELDEALAPARQADEVNARAAKLLQQTMRQVNSQIRATNDYIVTRRQAVGPEARAQLAEAIRLYNQAASLASSDPAAALDTAQQAAALAKRAANNARDDVNRWNSGGGVDIGGMVLGGILINSLLGGGRGMYGGFGPRIGGGWGGGGFGGGLGGLGGGFGGLGGRGGGFGGGFGGGGRGGGF